MKSNIFAKILNFCLRAPLWGIKAAFRFLTERPRSILFFTTLFFIVAFYVPHNLAHSNSDCVIKSVFYKISELLLLAPNGKTLARAFCEVAITSTVLASVVCVWVVLPILSVASIVTDVVLWIVKIKKGACNRTDLLSAVLSAALIAFNVTLLTNLFRFSSSFPAE